MAAEKVTEDFTPVTTVSSDFLPTSNLSLGHVVTVGFWYGLSCDTAQLICYIIPFFNEGECKIINDQKHQKTSRTFR